MPRSGIQNRDQAHYPDFADSRAKTAIFATLSPGEALFS
jgi:hypothetical protein